MLEEEKKSHNNNTFNDSKLQFKMENQRFLEQRQNDSSGSKLRKFESVFDTLRIFENKHSSAGSSAANSSVSFKWVPINVKKSTLLNKQIQQCLQCEQVQRTRTDEERKSLNTASNSNCSKFPRNAMLRAGYVYILKIPESLMQSQSSDDQHSSIMLSHQMITNAKKQFCIYWKGKIYRFENEHSDNATKMLDLRNCTMDLTTVQRPDQTVAQSASCNLEQAIQVNSLNTTFLFLSATKGDHLCKRRDIQDWFDYFKKYGVLLNMKSYYEIGNLAGKGNFARVYEATNYKTKEKYALKTIEKKILSKNRRNFFALLQEVTLLRRLDHVNIIHLHEVYESENNIHLILEYLNGGELFERIKQNGSYNERDASIIMRCILDALVAMHNKQVVHRDLKPENLLFKNDDISSLKIVDFGLSALVKDEPLSMRCGSPGYVAPEILNDLGYGTKADIFSAGIILYILLTGKFVFSGKNYREILLKNKECMVPFPPQYWSNLTIEAKDLVKKMLDKDPASRLSAAQALEHPWFKLNGSNLQHLQLSFEEVDDLQLTDDEPSLVNSVNLQLVTTSPIWNKTKMRDLVRRVNAEQDKQNTFQTPLPNPKFLSQKRHQESQQKHLKGVVLQNLYHQPVAGNNSNNLLIPASQRPDQIKKQHQTPNLRSTASSQQPAKVQNSTLNLLRSLFRKEESKPSLEQEPIKECMFDDSIQSQSINDESTEQVKKQVHIFEDDKIQEEEKIPVYNQYLGSSSTSQNHLNIPYTNNFSSNNASQQDMTQTSTPNQQPQPYQPQPMQDPNYEKVMKKWLDPSYMALSKVMEDVGLENQKSSNHINSQFNSNELNMKHIRDKATALRQQSVQQARNNMLMFDKGHQYGPQGQSLNVQQLHNMLIDNHDQPSIAQQLPLAGPTGGKKPPSQQLSPNSLSYSQQQQNPNKLSYSPNNLLRSHQNQPISNISTGNQDLKYGSRNVEINISGFQQSPIMLPLNRLNKDHIAVNTRQPVLRQQRIDTEESFGENELDTLDENTSGSNIIDQSKIVDFNAHSNNHLLQSRSTQIQKLRLEDQIGDNISPIKRVANNIEFGNLQNMHPNNISSASVNSNSFVIGSKNQSNFQLQGSQMTPGQITSDSNFSSANQLLLGMGTPNAPSQITGENSQASSSSQIQQILPVAPVLILKGQKSYKKSQFWGQVQHSESIGNEEANVEGQIDTEEQLINNMFHVPTTPGSVYGGSRGVMKHNIAPFQKYLPVVPQTPHRLSQASPINNMSQQSSSVLNQQSRQHDLQQNITFNNSYYFNRELSKSDTPGQRNVIVHQNSSSLEEEIKDSTPTPHYQRMQQERQAKYDQMFQQMNSDNTPLSSINMTDGQIRDGNNSSSINQEDSKSNSKLFNVTPDGDSSQDAHNIHKHLSENIQFRPHLVGERTISALVDRQISSLPNPYQNDIVARGISSANVSSSGQGNGDDKSFHTALQSMQDIQELAQNDSSSYNNRTISNQNNTTNNGRQYSWQAENGQNSSSQNNNISKSSFQDMSKEGRVGNNTENVVNLSGSGNNMGESNEYSNMGGSNLIKSGATQSQELIKHQHIANNLVGEPQYQKRTSGLPTKDIVVNNLRRTLINHI